MDAHKRALEVAYIDANEPWYISVGKVESSIQTYLTTLLDDPEMVEEMDKTIRTFHENGKHNSIYRQVIAVIAAIKKQAGIAVKGG